MAPSTNITAVVSYPSKHPESGEALKFNMEYYLSTHMPMIEKTWVENLKTAFEKGAATTMPDVEKFSNVFPAVWVGETGKSNVLSGGVAEGIARA
ncbi:hypothetical protein N0V83_006772 [Neocucurbitaria cava]|uniref:EthD domain-containing protein n=1 Tax=Neocucurbitaria cava TaxID=798079 RepID=A0A9W9CKK6_9PLEO|nr:hypothetical protein N0V83_006772 [Neocucurbitaria cava]